MGSVLGRTRLVILLSLIPGLSWSSEFEPAGASDLLQSGKYEEAINQIQDRIAADEATGVDYFILCAAQNRAGDYSSAIEAARHAEKLGFHSDAFDLEVGYAYLNAGKNKKAKQALRKYLSRHPQDTFAAELLARADKSASGPENSINLKDHVRFWLSPSFGHSSNPLALSDAQMLPSEYGSEEDSYIGVRFGANFREDPGGKEGFHASYNLSTRFYDDFSDYNSQFHRLTAGYKTRITKRMGLALVGGWNTYLLDNDRFRDQFIAATELSGRWNYHHRSIFRLSHYESNYRFTPLLQRLDRSGNEQELKLEHQWLQNQTRYNGGLVINHGNADGGDYDFDSVGGFLGLTHWLPQTGLGWLTGKPVLKLNVTYTARNYNNPSVFHDASDRDDDVVTYSATIQLPLINRFSVSFGCNRRDQSSNTEVFEFDQNNCNIGFAHLF